MLLSCKLQVQEELNVFIKKNILYYMLVLLYQNHLLTLIYLEV